MFGLVLGFRVAPRATTVAAVPAAARAERPIRILVRERPNAYGAYAGYAFVRGGSDDERSGAMPVPARPLVLTRGEPVAITVVNRATSPASIHWHGIELESYPDGVPGWSGSGQHLLPSIAPGDSLTVRFTPPRAGTFMYHSHFDEWRQISNGLYGAIVVLEPGERFDPETDRLLIVAKGGMTANVLAGPFAPLTLNGSADPAPMELRAGVAYRLRVINISDDLPTLLGLFDGERPATWRAIAKDGADLPASQATAGPAVLLTDPGEIHDFRFTPERAGELALRFGHPPIPGLPSSPQRSVAVRVR
jgi:FtsP/CotA-like multicopper oxidase with cupredoxin domain